MYMTSLVLSLLVLHACIPADTARSSSSDVTSGDNSSNTNGEFNDVTLSNLIFLKQGSQVTSEILTINDTNDGNFAIQGERIHQYITTNINDEFCLALTFPADNHVYFSYAIKQSFFNFSTGSQEYVWLIKPLDQATNATKCAATSLETQVVSDYGLVAPTFSYTASLACPNCNSRLSSTIKVYKANGETINDFYFQNQKILITSSSGGSDPGTTLSCGNGVTCPSGQCCDSFQCVSNGQVKPAVDQSAPLYLATLQNILDGLDTYANHQEYFFVCSTGSGGTGSTTNQNHEAQVFLQTLGEYVACTTPGIDEQGICTIRYKNAKALINPDNLPTPPSPGYSFSSRIDDLNFSGVNSNIPVSNNSIVKIIYGGQTLYSQEDSIALSPASGTINSTNDNMTSAQSVLIKAPLPVDALDDTLIIKYKTDISCKKQSNSFTSCTKHYNIGQTSSPARPSDFVIGTTPILLPNYANVTTFQSVVTVRVDHNIVASGPNTWQWDSGNPYRINFIQALYSGQKIEITYFVDPSLVNNVGLSSSIAQNTINDYCNPGSSATASLVPIYENQNGGQVIVGYNCEYSQDNGIPAEQVVQMSTQSIPHNYYDEFGVKKQETEIATSADQELEKFEYIGSNYLRPNNQDQYIGFNEIYGNFKTSGGEAIPAKEVTVKSGKIYTITVQEGSYSPCPSCGNDYYSNLVKLFPQNFTYRGGGLKPDLHIASHQVASTSIRSDDFKFGRACFVPATMIPWSHRQQASVTEQRRQRLQTQHFLFANGYQRDWYGFDYGSLIGSFDGVTWFSIGNQRKITAKTGTLYLAINGYFADVASANTMKVRVSEVISTIGSDVPETDIETDGAQCQKAHICQTDNDCLTQLGYDYACASVNELYTPWPVFDSLGREKIGSQNIRLTTLIGGTNGSNKRCVFRGAGSLCSINNMFPGSTSPYSSNLSSLHTCSTNSHCSSVSSSEFNDRIARYARPVLAQNSSLDIPTDSDLFGLGARILGRPYDYRGSKPVPANIASQLFLNNIGGICTPGRKSQTSGSADYLSQHSQTPALTEHSIMRNTGVTPNFVNGINQNYLSSCPTTDSLGNYVHSQPLMLNNPLVLKNAIRQNIASNLLQHSDFDDLNLFSDDNYLAPLTEKGMMKNICLRAPGASCFTDLECAPDKTMASKIKNGERLNLNEAEYSYWSEELVCGQKEIPKDIFSIINPDYVLNENKCCREVGKEITIFSNDFISPSYTNDKIAGIDLNLQENSRYTRLQTIYDRISTATDYKGLVKPAIDPAISDQMPISGILKSYNDFHAIASRTCCGQGWVRNFHEDNGGGHKWGANKAQTIDKAILKYLSWYEVVSGAPSCTSGPCGTPFECTPDNVNNADCSIANLSSEQEKNFLNYFARLELIGIPQIPIRHITPLVEESGLKPATPTNLSNIVYLPETIAAGAIPEFENDGADPIKPVFSASSESNNFDPDKIKPIFAEKDFTCCQSNGTQVSDENTCCSGTALNVGNSASVKVCCLPDYTNVSVYLNRYVSSEGAGYSDGYLNQETGYLDDPAMALQQAATMCCSKSAGFGIAVSPLAVPGAPLAPGTGTRRFLYKNNEVAPPGTSVDFDVNTEYDKGRRWNNQIYCLPSSGGGSGGGTVGSGT